MKKIILDTDTYNEADDIFALAYLLKNKDLFDIKAITIAPFKHSGYLKTVSDSIDDSYNETTKIFDYLNISDKSLIYKGSRGYLSNQYDEDNDAVRKIIELSQENNHLTIVAIGCLTNIALAIKKEPSIIDKIEIIWQGTNFLFGDNQDFNFRQDVEAVKTVFYSKVKLTVMPCSPITSNLMTSIYELKAEIGGKSELCDYLCDKFYNRFWGPHKRWPIWDIGSIAYLINRDWFKTMDISCPIINDDNTFTHTKGNHNITFVNQLNANSIYENFFESLIK